MTYQLLHGGCIGIDAVREYVDMSAARLLHATQQMEQGAA